MKKPKTNDLQTIPASLGMTLVTFCQVFDLNYDAMRKAASGNQELSPRQLGKWLAVRMMVQDVSEEVKREQQIQKAILSMAQLEKKLRDCKFYVMKFQRQIAQVSAKLEAERHGLSVLERFQSSGLPHHPTGRDYFLLKMLKQTTKTEKKLESLNVKLHTTQSMLWYYIEEKKTRQAQEKKQEKAQGHIRKSRTPRKRSIQDNVC